MHPALDASKAVVFDFYGTLIDDDVTVPPMWRHLQSLGYASHPEIEAIFEPNAFDGCATPRGKRHDAWVDSNWRAFLRLSGVPAAHEDDVLASLKVARENFVVRRAHGVDQLLSALRARGVRTALCSNWETPIEPYLELAGLDEFDAIVTSRQVGARKPHRRIFTEVVRRLDVAPSEAVFVGDTWSADVMGALRAGLRPVWLRFGRESRCLPHVWEVEALHELVGHDYQVSSGWSSPTRSPSRAAER